MCVCVGGGGGVQFDILTHLQKEKGQKDKVYIFCDRI